MTTKFTDTQKEMLAHFKACKGRGVYNQTDRRAGCTTFLAIQAIAEVLRTGQDVAFVTDLPKEFFTDIIVKSAEKWFMMKATRSPHQYVQIGDRRIDLLHVGFDIDRIMGKTYGAAFAEIWTNANHDSPLRWKRLHAFEAIQSSLYGLNFEDKVFYRLFGH